MPVQFAHCARLKPHGNSGDAFGNRQLLDCGFLPIAIADHFSFGFLKRKFERRQVVAGQELIRDIIHKTYIASRGWLGRRQRRRRQAKSADQNVSPLHVGHGIPPTDDERQSKR
jgi:hypothetical protein